MNFDRLKRISRFLSLVLRHCPEEVGLVLDKQGWADIDDLIQRTQGRFEGFDFETLDEIVRTNDKKRFEYDPTGKKIRACQGHSIDVDLEYKKEVPPFTLYHGTPKGNVQSILKTGLDKRNRTHVHLSDNIETARKVGNRRGASVVLFIEARRMHTDGLAFYCSTNGVWLTDHVPAQYIKATSEK